MESYKREFIQFLQSAGVLKFGDFTAKSGRKIPYFINAGMIKTGQDIATLGEFYARAYFEKLGKKAAVLYGPAYKGISLSVSAAVALSKNGLNVPFFFNRKEVKDHGEGGVFVGYVPTPGEEIVIIEDVITAGTAIRESMEILSHLEVHRPVHAFSGSLPAPLPAGAQTRSHRWWWWHHFNDKEETEEKMSFYLGMRRDSL